MVRHRSLTFPSLLIDSGDPRHTILVMAVTEGRQRQRPSCGHHTEVMNAWNN